MPVSSAKLRTAKRSAEMLLDRRRSIGYTEDTHDLPPAGTLYEFFVNYVWPILEPGRKFKHNWHIELLCEELEHLYYQGEAAEDLLINIAPRHLKSRIVSIAFPCWVWTMKAYARFLCLSYAGPLSSDHNQARRKVIRSSQYQALTQGRCILSISQNEKNNFENVSGGVMAAKGFEGAVTGIGGDYIIVDDPHNPETVESKKRRTTTLKRFASYSVTRRDDPKATKVIVVMQRTHELDVSGFCIERGYRHVKLPTVAVANQIVEFPRSGKQIAREKGDLLHPSRIGPDEVKKYRATLGSYMWAARHQQEPAPLGGGLYKRKHWRFWQPSGAALPPIQLYDENGVPFHVEAVQRPAAFLETVQSWDCAFKDLENSDNVAGQVWGRWQSDYYLLDEFCAKANIQQTCTAVTRFREMYPMASRVLIEGKANGPAVMQLLAGKISGLQEVEPKGGKESRAVATQPSVESGNTYLPHPAIAPWVWEFMEEHEKFPTGAHDDRVDAHTQAIVDMLEREAGYFRTPPEPERKKRAFANSRITTSQARKFF